jgi:CRP/FNR family cyclic AMP-dependent transcriptional regulator
MALFFRKEREWSTRDVAYLVRSHELFSMLTQAEGVALVEHMRPQKVKSGTVLFHEGQKNASFMALILEGEASVETQGAGHGEAIMLKVLGEGDLIGEQGILDNGARSATVTAATDMGLATLSQTQFNRLVKAQPALGCKMLLSIVRTVTRRLRDSNKRLHMLSQLNRTMGEELEKVSTPNVKDRVYIPDIVPRPAPKRTGEAFQPPDSAT